MKDAKTAYEDGMLPKGKLVSKGQIIDSIIETADENGYDIEEHAVEYLKSLTRDELVRRFMRKSGPYKSGFGRKVDFYEMDVDEAISFAVRPMMRVYYWQTITVNGNPISRERGHARKPYKTFDRAEYELLLSRSNTKEGDVYVGGGEYKFVHRIEFDLVEVGAFPNRYDKGMWIRPKKRSSR